MNSLTALKALRSAIASVLSDLSFKLDRRTSMRRCISERLEARQMLNAEWITIDEQNSSIPGDMWEGQTNSINVQFVSETPYLAYGSLITDGINTPSYGQLSNYWEAFHEDSGATVTMDLEEDFGWMMGNVWHQEWTVYNVQPTARISQAPSFAGDNIVVSLTGGSDVSSADLTAGLRYSFATEYAGLAATYGEAATASSQSLDPESDSDGVIWGRVFDKDGGYSDYNTSYALPTINWQSNEAGAIRFGWSDVVTGESNWQIQRAPYGGTFATIATVAGNRTSYTDKTVVPGDRYQYRVRAIGNGQDTAFSAKRAVTAILPTPTNVVASIANDWSNNITVAWTASQSEHYQKFTVQVFAKDADVNSTPLATFQSPNGTSRSLTFDLDSIGSSAQNAIADAGGMKLDVFANNNNGGGAGNSTPSDAAEPMHEPDSNWTRASTFGEVSDPQDHAVPYVDVHRQDRRPNQPIDGESNYTNETVKYSWTELPRHSYLSGYIEFEVGYFGEMVWPEHREGYDPKFEAKLGGQKLTVKHEYRYYNTTWTYNEIEIDISIPGNWDAVDTFREFWIVYLEPKDSDDGAIKHEGTTLDLSLKMSALPLGEPNYCWAEKRHDIWSYFPFVAVSSASENEVLETDRKNAMAIEREHDIGFPEVVLDGDLEVKIQYGGDAVRGKDFGAPVEVRFNEGDEQSWFLTPNDNSLPDGNRYAHISIIPDPSRYKVYVTSNNDESWEYWKLKIIDDEGGLEGGLSLGNGTGGNDPRPDGDEPPPLDEPPPPPDPVPPDGGGGGDGGGTPPELPGPPTANPSEKQNFINLVAGGWGVDYHHYAWSYASTVEVAGISGTPGAPPTTESIYLGVNDDFDEQNVDALGNLLPDYQVGVDGDRVDGDVVPLWMDIWSTDYKDVSPADGIDDDLGQITLNFPSEVKIWRPNPEGAGWVPMESGESIDLNAWYDQGRSDDWYWGWAPGVLVEGLSTSSGLHGTNISATFSKGEAGDATDTVRFTIVQTDADVDSDNDNGTDAPDRNSDEDSIESQYDYESPDYPGKVLAVNDDDTDGDGIPDFADGFNFDNNVSDTIHQLDDEVDGEHFTPLVLELASPINTATARVYLSYNSSAPMGVTKTTNSTTGITTYKPGSGTMRVWLTPGGQSRSGYSLKNASNDPYDTNNSHGAGDYVEPGQWYTWAELAGSGRTKTLWMEAIQASSYTGQNDVSIYVDPDGDGPAWAVAWDQARTTAFTTQRVEITDSGSIVPATTVSVSTPAPIFRNVSISATNLRYSANFKHLIGDLIVSGSLDDAASDLIPGSDGTINQIFAFLNGAVEPSSYISTASTKVEKPTSLLAPHDFSASFSQTITGIELRPGWNNLALSATNYYGYSGAASKAFSVDITLAPVEVELEFSDDLYLNSLATIDIRFHQGTDSWSTPVTLTRGGAFSDHRFVNGEYVVDFTSMEVLNQASPDVRTAMVSLPGYGALQALMPLTEQGNSTGDFTGAALPQPEHEIDYRHFTPSLGVSEAVIHTDPGEIKRYMLEYRGPAVMADDFKVQVSEDVQAEWVMLEGTNRYFMSVPDTGAPAISLLLSNNTPPPVDFPDDEVTLKDAASFAGGLAVGLVNGGVSDVTGAIDLITGIPGAVKGAFVYLQDIGVRYVDGDLFIQERTFFRKLEKFASAVADIVQQVLNNNEAVVAAIQSRNYAPLNQISPELRLAVEYSVELLGYVIDEIDDMSAYERGKVVGGMLYEVVSTILPMTKLGKVSKLKVLQQLGGNPLFASVSSPTGRAYAKLIDLIQDMAAHAPDNDTLQSVRSIALKAKKKFGANSSPMKILKAIIEDPSVKKTHLDEVLHIFVGQTMKEVYDAASGDWTKVPTYRQLTTLMAGRSKKAMLEAHHVAVNQWTKQLVAGITDDELLDMPAIMLNYVEHGTGDFKKGFGGFHEILDDIMAEDPPLNHADILENLEKAYSDWDAVNGPKVWAVARSWLTSKAVP